MHFEAFKLKHTASETSEDSTVCHLLEMQSQLYFIGCQTIKVLIQLHSVLLRQDWLA